MTAPAAEWSAVQQCGARACPAFNSTARPKASFSAAFRGNFVLTALGASLAVVREVCLCVCASRCFPPSLCYSSASASATPTWVCRQRPADSWCARGKQQTTPQPQPPQPPPQLSLL